MRRTDHKKRAAELLRIQTQRAASQRRRNTTPSSSRSSPLFLGTPTSTPGPSKRQRTIKPEDEVDIHIPSDPSGVPENVLTFDPKAGEIPLPHLDEEQRQAVRLALQGRSMFLTGSAGSGKSTVLRWIIMYMRSKSKVVYVTAPTGQAASQIGGITYHSYMGWDIDIQQTPIKEVSRKAQGDLVSKRLTSTDVLIIDEISMVSNHSLSRINRALQSARDDDEPFGGMQVVFCGDFCQLPPIKPFEFCWSCGKAFQEKQKRSAEGREGKSSFYECRSCDTAGEYEWQQWAFMAKIWEEANLTNVHLRENHRQGEGEFMNILKLIRSGQELSIAERALLVSHDHHAADGIKLFSNNAAVKALNAERLTALPGEAVTYFAWDDFSHNPEHAHLAQRAERSVDGSLMSLMKHRYDRKLELKLGEPVVLQANLDLDRNLVNGSHGRIVNFEPWDEKLIPNAGGFDHSLDLGFDSDGNARPQLIARRGFGDMAVHREEQVKRFMMSDKNQQEYWPVVQFNNGRKVTIFPNCSIAILGDSKPYTMEMRTQVPLAPGWAMTFHKAQGATLEKVVVDLADSFSPGMAYVALSRATSLDGLLVTSLGHALDREKANEDVTNFYRLTVWDVGGFE